MSRARCTIDHAAIRHNLEHLGATVGDGCQVWPVVKADAYGHGAVEVAHTCAAAGSERLCVANVSEALELRDAGIETALLVMGPIVADDIRVLADANVEVAITHEAIADHIIAADLPVRVHLKVDTGMGRWGVAPSQAGAIAQRLVDADSVTLVGLMTHFATADADDPSFVHEQLNTFTPVVDEVRELAPNIVVHAANTAAILHHPDTHFDAVRTGVGTYGLDPCQTDAAAVGLQPAMAVTSHVSSTRTLERGASTGYNRSFVADEPTTIALVPVGYADGVRRALSGRGQVVIDGARRAMAGTISMDHISVIVDQAVQPGANVTIIGRSGDAHVTAEDHAAWAGTINYEITCGIASDPRLERVHDAFERDDESSGSRPAATRQ